MIASAAIFNVHNIQTMPYLGNSHMMRHQMDKVESKRSSGRQKRTSASCSFPGTMTTETTVSKGQEFFSPGQTEGNTGGTLIGSAAVLLLLLTQLRWTMCAIGSLDFYSRLIATARTKRRTKTRRCRGQIFSPSQYQEEVRATSTERKKMGRARQLISDSRVFFLVSVADFFFAL